MLNTRISFFIILLNICYSIPCSAQYSYKDVDRRKIIVKTDDDIIEAEVYDGFDNKKIKDDRNYYWCDHNMIMSSVGGFTGELLHGDFLIQYRNYQIKEKGEFKFGLKCGIWKKWYETGKPKEVVKYKKGVASGPYTLYNSQGITIEKGNNKNGNKNGMISTFSNDGVETKVKYVKGQELIKLERKPKKQDNEKSVKQDKAKVEKKQSENKQDKGLDKKDVKTKYNKPSPDKTNPANVSGNKKQAPVKGGKK
jgi:hypothetical protein